MGKRMVHKLPENCHGLKGTSWNPHPWFMGKRMVHKPFFLRCHQLFFYIIYVVLYKVKKPRHLHFAWWCPVQYIKACYIFSVLSKVILWLLVLFVGENGSSSNLKGSKWNPQNLNSDCIGPCKSYHHTLVVMAAHIKKRILEILSYRIAKKGTLYKV